LTAGVPQIAADFLQRPRHRGVPRDRRIQFQTCADAIETIREHNPGIADEDAVNRFMDFQRETIALLGQGRVWRDVEKVATTLIADGKLSNDEVVALVDAQEEDAATAR
jgi:hypothetical protein